MSEPISSETQKEALDTLGRVMAKVYDNSIAQVDVVISKSRPGPLSTMTEDQLDALKRAAPELAATVLFQLLAELMWQETCNGPVRLSVRVGDKVLENPADSSDHLAGELIVPSGWLSRFATKPIPSSAES
jgi:hypothetical protein